MLGPLPGHPHPPQGSSHGCVAAEPRGEALGATALGGERERPPARGRAKRPRPLMPPRPQGLAGPRSEEGRRGVRARRQGLEHSEPAMLAGMNDVAYGLSGAAEAASHRGRRLALGTGEEELAAVDGTGGRSPTSGLPRRPLVRRERAHKEGCLPI